MLSARSIATLYDLHVAAIWRGDASSRQFELWLADHWCEGPTTEPLAAPDAISLLGAAGAGIRWYEQNRNLIGCVPSRSGSYRIARDDVPPSIGNLPGTVISSSVGIETIHEMPVVQYPDRD